MIPSVEMKTWDPAAVRPASCVGPHEEWTGLTALGKQSKMQSIPQTNGKMQYKDGNQKRNTKHTFTQTQIVQTGT